MKKKTKKIVVAKRKKLPLDFFIIALLFPLFALLIMTGKKPLPTVKIPPENTKETTNWKLYQNNDFYFSFKYPDYILSHFSVDTYTDTYQKVKELAFAKEGNLDGIPTYNVYFEANAWKYDKSLDDFISNGPLKIKGEERQNIVLGEYRGVRITNKNSEKNEDAYYLYNLFKKDNYVYNFAILTDDKTLIGGNSDLLEKIISTAKFFPSP